jgi:rod shape-determining protein MreD
MVRTGLATKRRLNAGPRSLAAYIPAISVLAAALLQMVPAVSLTGWFPDFGYLVFIAWRLLRADPWPAWWAAPLGLANDLITGGPIGLSVALWTATMIVLDLIDRRTMWRDYWIEWALAAVLLTAAESLDWWAAGAAGAVAPYNSIVEPLLIAVFAFPIAAFIVSRIDRWRLGR